MTRTWGLKARIRGRITLNHAGYGSHSLTRDLQEAKHLSATDHPAVTRSLVDRLVAEPERLHLHALTRIVSHLDADER